MISSSANLLATDGRIRMSEENAELFVAPGLRAAGWLLSLQVS